MDLVVASRLRRSDRELADHMVRMVTLLGLPESRHTEILFTVHEIEPGKRELCMPAIDNLAQAVKIRHGLLEMADRSSRTQRLADREGLNNAADPNYTADQVKLLVMAKQRGDGDGLVA